MTADAVTNWEDRLFPLLLSRPRPNPMTQIQFDYGNVTISDGVIQAPSPTITALLDTLAAARRVAAPSRACLTRTSTLHKVSSVW